MATHTAIPPDDRCCAKAWSKAALSGALDAADSWQCPKCGCDWLKRMDGELACWEPHEFIAIF